MTVNFFGFEMVQEYFPTEAKPTSIMTYTDGVLTAFYKCFTTGFETQHLITDCVAEDNKYRATVSSQALVITAGSLIKTNTVARVLEINKQGGKCELLLDTQLDNGVITVCGLGFIPESIDFAARTFTVRDSKYGKPMTFRLNFRDNLTDAGRKPNQPLVSLIVNGDERRLLPHSSVNTLQAVETYDTASFMVFRSFVSNGSFLWYTVRPRGDNRYTGINSLGYGYCGWLNENVLLCPATTYNGTYNTLCATMDTHDATTDWSNDNASKLCFIGLNLIDVVPITIKPWQMSLRLGGTNAGWKSSFSSNVVGLGNIFLCVGAYMFKLPGMQYAPIVGPHTPSKLFEYDDKHIITGEAYNESIPRYFSLDEKDWEQ